MSDDIINISFLKKFTQRDCEFTLHAPVSSLSAAPARDCGMHVHGGWELFFILSGTFSYYIRGMSQVQSIKAPAVILWSPECWHSASFVVHPVPRECTWFSFLDRGDSLYGLYAGKMDKKVFFWDSEQVEMFKSWLGGAVSDYVSRLADALSLPDGVSYCLNAIKLLVDCLLLAEKENKSLLVHSLPPLIAAEMILKARYFDVDLDLRTLAAEVGVSEVYLSGLFRSKTGRTFKETLTDVRLSYGRKLCEDTSLAVKEIANLTGWRDPLYFSKVFRKAFGLSPRQYRKILNKS
jgi:AraC-like DNA-binding protein